jgi:hypothetical protein
VACRSSMFCSRRARPTRTGRRLTPGLVVFGGREGHFEHFSKVPMLSGAAFVSVPRSA